MVSSTTRLLGVLKLRCSSLTCRGQTRFRKAIVVVVDAVAVVDAVVMVILVAYVSVPYRQ